VSKYPAAPGRADAWHPSPRGPQRDPGDFRHRLLALAVFLTTSLAVPLAGAASPPQRPLFREVAASVGLDFVHFNGMTGELYFPETMGAGGALFDYDRDGDLDVYLVQGAFLDPRATMADALRPVAGPLHGRLYRNDLRIGPDGRRELRFADVTEESGIRAAGYGMGVAAGDVDNDGWTDLYLTNLGPNQLWHNDGDGTFSEVTARAGVDDPRWSVPAVFFDYDRDGWLDLFVGNYVAFTVASHKLCRTVAGEPDYCGPQTYRAETDRLFRNRGDGTFEDVSVASGIRGPSGAALGAVATDLDGDGLPDLYVANDGMPNRMWINRGDGTFEDRALFAGTAVNRNGEPEASMGVAAGDLDGDGDDDLAMTHLTLETNTVYLNDGSGLFDDASAASGLGPPSVAWTGFGAAWLDFDLDGLFDLATVNGAVRLPPDPTSRAPGDDWPLAQPNQLFGNAGGGRFVEVSDRAGPGFTAREVSRGLAAGDVDEDGDPDLLVTNASGPVRLLLNQAADGSHWLGLRLVGAGGRDMLGARVAVHRPAAPPLVRRADSGGSYASASDPRVLVGLGADPAVERVVVTWPDGTREEWRVEADRYTTLRQGEGRSLPAAGTAGDAAGRAGPGPSASPPAAGASRPAATIPPAPANARRPPAATPPTGTRR